MEQCPVIAPPAWSQCVEGRAEARITRCRRRPLRPDHDDPAAEAHPPRKNVGQTGLAPVTFNSALRVRAIETLDARSEEGVDVAPRPRKETATKRHHHARVHPPQCEGERRRGDAELERRQAATRLQYASELG